MSDAQSLVAQTAASLGVDPGLALAVASAESNFNQNVSSKKGAIGVMQLEPATAAQLGVNPYDLADNIRGGVLYLKQQLSRFGDPALALAAYNWGPARVASAIAIYGSDWLSHAPSETRAYVSKILDSAFDSAASVVEDSAGTFIDSGETPAAVPLGGLTLAALAIGAYLVFGS